MSNTLFLRRTPVEDLATRRSLSSWISTATNDLSRSKSSVVLPSFSKVEGKERRPSNNLIASSITLPYLLI